MTPLVEKEEVLYGIHACEAASLVRRDAVIKVTLTEELVPRFSELLKYLAQTKRAYRITSADELSRMTKTVHHGGVSMILKRRAHLSLLDWLARVSGPTLGLALVGVENPHNVGAIARSAYHFGANALLFTHSVAGMTGGSAYRVARGALEYLNLISTKEGELLSAKNVGFELVALSPRGGEQLRGIKFRERTILLLGSEEAGLSRESIFSADRIISIPGNMESLNVSVAAATTLYEWSSQQEKEL